MGMTPVAKVLWEETCLPVGAAQSVYAVPRLYPQSKASVGQ